MKALSEDKESRSKKTAKTGHDPKADSGNSRGVLRGRKSYAKTEISRAEQDMQYTAEFVG